MKASLGQAGAMQWYEIKIWLESSTGLDRDALHIYGAVGIQLLCALVFKRSLGSVWPWSIAFAASLLNEYIDFQRAGDIPAVIEIHKAEAYHDLWNTMVLPTVLLFIARFWPVWLVGSTAPSVVSHNPEIEPENVT